MSKAKFEAARELIRDKKYTEARALLKTIDHPQARQWEAKLNQIMPVDEPDDFDESAQPSLRKPNWIPITAGIIGLVIVVGIGIVLLSAKQRNDAIADAEATLSYLVTMQAIDVSSTLQVYCTDVSERSKGDCDRWSNEVITTRYAQAKACQDEYDWIYDRRNYSGCLLIEGIAVLGGQASVPGLDIQNMSDLDVGLAAGAMSYCGQIRTNEDYCYIWGLMTYMQFKQILNICETQFPHLQKPSEFGRCLESHSMKP